MNGSILLSGKPVYQDLAFEEWQVRREIGARLRSIPRRRSARFFHSTDSEADIYGLTQLLQQTMHTCCEIHHFTAKLHGSNEMDELRDHAICAGYRSNTEDTIDVAIDRLGRENVFANSGFAKMLIGLDAVKMQCGVNCMLLEFTVERAPHLCKPAEFMGCQPESSSEESNVQGH